VRVTPDIAPNTPASGQPVNVVLSPDKRFAYIVNHSGSVHDEGRRRLSSTGTRERSRS
jgi:hypothetical protein